MCIKHLALDGPGSDSKSRLRGPSKSLESDPPLLSPPVLAPSLGDGDSERGISRRSFYREIVRMRSLCRQRFGNKTPCSNPTHVLGRSQKLSTRHSSSHGSLQEDKLSKHQIRGGGAASSEGLQGKGLQKRVLFVHRRRW